MAFLIETDRLSLREFTAVDAPFILELLNDPDWIKFIGNRGVKTLDDARGYIERGPAALQARHGYSLWRVATRDENRPVGMCGLIKRDHLEHPDLGFAFLPAARGRGYAREAASACLAHGRDALGLTRILAITVPANAASIRLLGILGMTFERMSVDPVDGAELRVYAWEA